MQLNLIAHIIDWLGVHIASLLTPMHSAGILGVVPNSPLDDLLGVRDVHKRLKGHQAQLIYLWLSRMKSAMDQSDVILARDRTIAELQRKPKKTAR